LSPLHELNIKMLTFNEFSQMSVAKVPDVVQDWKGSDFDKNLRKHGLVGGIMFTGY